MKKVKKTETIKDPIVIAFESLIESILSIPGNKIITLGYGDEAFSIDIDKDGNYGHQVGDEEIFKAKLFSAFHVRGAVIIRQFLSEKIRITAPNGKRIDIPKKNIYSISIYNGDWFPHSKETMEWAHNTEYGTGKILLPEEGVSFIDFPNSIKKGY